MPPFAANTGAVVDICKAEQLDDMELNLMWHLGPGALQDAAEDVDPSPRALKSSLEDVEFFLGSAVNDAKNDLFPSARVGEVEIS